MATHNEVCHAWANDTGRARRGFNMYWEGEGSGRTIYSYGRHFPIARFVADTTGREVVLFTTGSYSVSTSKHMTYTRRAIPRAVSVFNVPHLKGNRHADNAASYLSRIVEYLDKASRARVNGPWLLEAAERTFEEFRRYVEAFDVPAFGDILTLDDVKPGAAKLAEEAREAAERANRERERRAREDYRERRWPAVKAWLRGEEVPGYGMASIATPRPLPRVNGDTVQTTWGASVPLEAALKAYGMAKSCRRAHRGFKPSGLSSPRFGDFQLQEIKPNGDLVIGCHDIPYHFMRYAAMRAGLEERA